MALAKFSYSKAKHVVIGELPFKVAYGVKPLMPTDLALEGVQSEFGKIQVAEDFVVQREAMLEKIKLHLDKAQERCIKQVNKGRCHVNFVEGQKVWLNVKNFTLSERLTPKFMAKYACPFVIAKRLFEDVFKLELPQGKRSGGSIWTKETIQQKSCIVVDEDINLC